MAERTQTTLEQRAIAALAAFPLPTQSLNSMDNYLRILTWLFQGEGAISSLVVDLEKRNRASVKEANRLIDEAFAEAMRDD